MMKIFKYILIVIVFIFCFNFVYSQTIQKVGSLRVITVQNKTQITNEVVSTNTSTTDADPGITLLEILSNESEDEISDLKDSKDEEEAAVPMYTKIDDIKGESTDEKDDESGQIGFGDGETGKRLPTASADEAEETGDNTRKTVRDQDIPTPSKKPKEIIVVDPKSREEKEWIDILSITPATEEQLEEYVEATVALDDAIEEVAITDEKVTMKYKHPAKLFGLIKVDYTMSASVDKQGVKVEYPWWVRFSKNYAKDLKTELEKELSDDAQLANIDLQNHLKRKKQIVQTLSNIMKKT